MRILFITQWFDPEPGAIRGLPLARYLAARGDDVEVLTGFPNYPGGKIYPGYEMKLWQRENIGGIRVLRVPLYPSHNSSAVARVANYASFALSSAMVGQALVRPADVVFVYHPPATVGLSALLKKYFRRIPYVYHIADMWPESVVDSGMMGSGLARRAANSAIAAWCGLLYRNAYAISVLSPGFKRLLIERGVPDYKVHVIYNWTDEDVFKPLPKDTELARELGAGDTFNLVYAGNLGGFQGLEIAIRTAALLTDVPSFRLIIVGTGQKEAELKSLAEGLACKNIVFVGRREYWDMPRFYSIADALLIHLKDFPFFATTIPSKTQVSMACGRPILMAVRGDAADLITRAQAGIVCPPDDPEAMAQTVRRFMALPQTEREKMGASGREFYLSHMSLAEGAQRTRDLLQTAASSRFLSRRAHA